MNTIKRVFLKKMLTYSRDTLLLEREEESHYSSCLAVILDHIPDKSKKSLLTVGAYVDHLQLISILFKFVYNLSIVKVSTDPRLNLVNITGDFFKKNARIDVIIIFTANCLKSPKYGNKGRDYLSRIKHYESKYLFIQDYISRGKILKKRFYRVNEIWRNHKLACWMIERKTNNW